MTQSPGGPILRAVHRRRLIMALTVLLGASALLATAGEAAAPVKKIASYCTPKRDICYGIVLKRGVAVYFEVTTERHYFGWYRLCVSGGAGLWRCNVYRLRRVGWLATSSVSFSRQYRDVGPGPYRVRWSLGRRPLGPILRFQLN